MLVSHVSIVSFVSFLLLIDAIFNSSIRVFAFSMHLVALLLLLLLLGAVAIHRGRSGRAQPSHARGCHTILLGLSPESEGDREGDGPRLLHDRPRGCGFRRSRQDPNKAAKRGYRVGQSCSSIVRPHSGHQGGEGHYCCSDSCVNTESARDAKD